MHWNDYNIPDDPPSEEEFMEHVFDLMDQVAKYKLYWILGDAFTNAGIFILSGGDKGYWEYVHNSIINGINMRYSHIKQCECESDYNDDGLCTTDPSDRNYRM